MFYGRLAGDGPMVGGKGCAERGLMSGRRGIAVSASDLFVVNQTGGTIGKYTTSGGTVNPALISGLFAPYAIAVVATIPEPGSAILTLFGLVLAGLAISKIEKRWHNGCGWAYQSNERQTLTALMFHG